MKKLKVAILIDSIVNKGGIERMMLEIAKFYDADIYVGDIDYKTTFSSFSNLNISKITTKKFSNKFNTLHIWYKFRTLRLKQKYNLYILSGTGALNSAKKYRPNLWYCTSPSRYLYDLYKREKSYQKGIGKLLFPIITSIQRKIDRFNVSYVDKIISISKNIEKRVKKYYNRNSTVIYPFVDIDKFKYISQGDFYLSVARLDRIKRIDLIINAFKKMSNKKLIIASSGPEENKLKKLAKGYKNIIFLGYVTESKLKELYGTCIATLYLSYMEDFGLIPVESMSAGKPCIATNQGGFKETIIHKKTGFLVDNPTKVNEVIDAVEWLDKKQALLMKNECIKRSKIFSQDKILKEIDKLNQVFFQ